MRRSGSSVAALLVLVVIFMVQAVFGPDFALLPTGELMIDWLAEGRPRVQLTPEETYALLMFLRLPGVADVIQERGGAARQDQNWRAYDAYDAPDM